MINHNQKNQALVHALENIPSTVSVQFEIPKIKKMLKLSLNTKNSIKHHVALFTSKFEADFSSFAITAFIKINNQKFQIQEDIPFRYILALHKPDCAK